MPKPNVREYKVVAISDNSGTGTTCILQRLAGKGFNDSYRETLGVDFEMFRKDGSSARLWSMAGAKKYANLRSAYLSSVSLVLYCVDLSTLEDSSIEKIKQGIVDIKQQAPYADVILVATKSDLYSGNSQDALVALSQQVGSDSCVVTSAKTGVGIDYLIDFIGRGIHEIQIAQSLLDSWEHSVWLTFNQKNNLIAELNVLALAMDQLIIDVKASTLTKNQADAHLNGLTDMFVANCHGILEGKHPDIMAAVYTFATAVVAAGVIALAGIAFGLAVLPLSITSGIGAAVSAGLTLNSVFKDRSHINAAIGTFSQQILDGRIAPAAS